MIFNDFNGHHGLSLDPLVLFRLIFTSSLLSIDLVHEEAEPCGAIGHAAIKPLLQQLPLAADAQLEDHPRALRGPEIHRAVAHLLSIHRGVHAAEELQLQLQAMASTGVEEGRKPRRDTRRR